MRNKNTLTLQEAQKEVTQSDKNLSLPGNFFQEKNAPEPLLLHSMSCSTFCQGICHLMSLGINETTDSFLAEQIVLTKIFMIEVFL